MTQAVSEPTERLTWEEQCEIEAHLCRQSRLWMFERHCVIKNKEGNLQLLSPLKRAQRKALAVIEGERKAKRPVRVIIGKSRKQGESTIIEADLFAEVLERGIDALVITHKKDLSEYVFGITSRYYQYWDKSFQPGIPPLWKPELYKGHTNKGELRFQRHEGKILIDTANNLFAGTGTTPQYLHNSEGSKWAKGSETAKSLNQAIGRKAGTTVVDESTFNGYDSLFLPKWEAAWNNSRIKWIEDPVTKALSYQFEVTNHKDWNGFIPIFISAMEDEDIWERFADKDDRRRFIETLDPYEQNLLKNMGATPEFLHGRRLVLKTQCENDLDTLKQEYPVTPVEAVRASGRARFDHNFIDAQPVEPGESVSLHYSDRWDRRIEYKRDRMSPLTVFRHPVSAHRYTIGVDVAEGKLDDNGKIADASVCDVYDLDQGMEQVAVLSGQDISEEMIPSDLKMIGEYYNGAFIVIANISIGKHVAVEMGKIYPGERLYHHPNSREIGFHETIASKPILIGGLAEAVSANEIVFRYQKTIDELRRYIKKPGGGTGAESGYHDDHVVSAALAVVGAKAYPMILVNRQPTTLLGRFTAHKANESRSQVTGY